jgi:Flp pilus assembly pilin Flp
LIWSPLIILKKAGGNGMSKTIKKFKSGQSMTEYIIIVAIIALAAVAIFGLFGDRIRQMVGGAVTTLGGNQSDVDTANQNKSEDFLKTLGKSGGQ